MLRTFAGTVLLTFVLFGNGVAQATEIEVVGNERTRTSFLRKVVLDCLEHHVDKTPEGYDLPSLQQCVMNTKLFVAVTVEAIPVGYRLTVEEKWTLIPIPYAKVSSGDERGYGIFLLESNFLGLGKLLVLGATASERGNGYFLFLNDRAVALTNFTASVVVARSVEVVQDLQAEDKVLQELGEARTSAKVTGGYTLGPWSFQSGLRRRKLVFDADELLQPLDYMATSATLRGEFRRTDYRIFFDHGPMATVDLEKDIAVSGRSNLASVRTVLAYYGVELPWHHAWLWRLRAGEVTDGSVDDLTRLGGQPGFRGIPAKSVWARRHGAFSLDYQGALHRAAYGTWAFGLFSETGKLWHDADLALEPTRWATTGAGVYLFMKGVAIPGIGVEFGSNQEFAPRFVNVTVGFSI